MLKAQFVFGICFATALCSSSWAQRPTDPADGQAVTDVTNPIGDGALDSEDPAAIDGGTDGGAASDGSDDGVTDGDGSTGDDGVVDGDGVPGGDGATDDAVTDDDQTDSSSDSASGSSNEFDVDMHSGGFFLFCLFGGSSEQQATMRFFETDENGDGDLEVDVELDDGAQLLDGTHMNFELSFGTLWFGMAASENSKLASFGIRSEKYLLGRAFGSGDLSGQYRLFGQATESTESTDGTTGNETTPTGSDDSVGSTDTPGGNADQNPNPGADTNGEPDAGTSPNTDVTGDPTSEPNDLDSATRSESRIRRIARPSNKK